MACKIDKIKVYIINLATSILRKKYMQGILEQYSFLEPYFIEAIDGRIIQENEQNSIFDKPKSIKRYGRSINGGEIGCTLSHFKCYNKLIESYDRYVLILEDDITLIRDLKKLDWNKVEEFMSVKEPRIMFLSGDYWYWDKKSFTRVFSAVGSYAYLINREAALRILKIKRPSNVADDWDVYKQLGVKLFAVYPYMIDANIADIPSEIQQDYWGNYKDKMSLKYVLRVFYVGIIKRYLEYKGNFESKVRTE